MTKSKHTPGPWEWQGEYDIEAYPEEAGKLYIIGSNLGGLVGAALPLATELDSRDFARVEANARLIAAAPGLLEALKRLCDYSKKPTQEDWQTADAAIAKAEDQP